MKLRVFSARKLAGAIRTSGMEPHEVAARVCVALGTQTTQKDIQRYTEGEGRPSVNVAYALAHVLGCSMDELAA